MSDRVLDITCDHRLEQEVTGACGHCYEQRGIYIKKIEAENKKLKKENRIAIQALFDICQNDWGIGHSIAKPAHKAINKLAAIEGEK